MNGSAWSWLLVLPATLLVAAALCHLRARRIVGLPRTAINRWRRASPIGKLLVCILAVQLAYTGATKRLRNPPPAREATGVSLPRGAPLRGSGTLAASPADELGVSVTNLCFAAIERGTNSTALLLAWPPEDRPPLDRVGLFAARELPGPWSHLLDVDVSACASNALVEVMDSEMPTNSPSTAFFRIGDPAPPDADSDGLSDAEEIGEITVRNEFEWHDTTGFTTVYGEPPPTYWFGEDLLSLTIGLPGCSVVQGIALTGLSAFENGFVGFRTPGDWNDGVVPYMPYSLSYRAFLPASIMVAPYWGTGYVQYGNTNSYMRAGMLADGTAVVEFHDVKSDRWSAEGMTYQVIVPGGTGDVVRVSYLSSDIPLDGSNVVVGVQNARRTLPGGMVYGLEWVFVGTGPIVPPVTVEYRFGLGTDPDSADSDNDGLDDWTELYETGTDPWKRDTDGDGLSDGTELALGTNPQASDTDGDGLPDAWEVANGLDPLSDVDEDGASGDPDEDSLTNAQERQLGTDPQEPDTDNDGLDDDAEIALGTDPLNPDADEDGLLDGYEVNVLGSSPFLHDTDGDGLNDGEEDALGTNPSSDDTDGDGMDDKWEHQYGFDPAVHNSQTARTDDDGDADYDQDGLGNLQEHAIGTNPLLLDTDGEGFSDYDEITAGTNPCFADTDGDGLDDLQEQTLATNPLQPDTDGDGMNDGWERRHGFDPKTHNSSTARTDDDVSADPDGDNLTNAEECKWGTNPSGADADGNGIPDGRDTDGDGVADGVEIAQNSDPADASDGGQPGSRVPVPFYFGDHSGSHSEKYLLTVEPVADSGEGTPPRTFSCVNALYGECETHTNMLKRGWRYKVRLRHAGTDPAYSGTPRPDYDYTLRPVTNNLPPYVQMSDPDSLFGVDDASTSFSAKNKKATISVYKFSVEEIKFNHDTTSCSLDAVTIRRNAREGFDTSHGEWWTGGTHLKNDPVCYAGGAVPTVKARIRASPSLNSARLSARTVGTGSPIGGLSEKFVQFSDGLSNWTDFPIDSAIMPTVRKFDHRWEWKVTQMNGAAVTAFVCVTTGPHRVYTVISAPMEPWVANPDNRQNPWTNALEFACSIADGKSDRVQVLAEITTNLFAKMGFTYETNEGRASYWNDFRNSFQVSGYLSHTKPTVNCYDQAYGVATFGNLAGVYSTPVFTQPFGFINTVNLVGIGPCNNPFYTSPYTTVHVAISEADDKDRSAFGNHMYVFAEGVVFDACAGPELGTKGHVPYLRSVIDSSTDDELLASFFSPYDFLQVQRKLVFRPKGYKLE